VRISRLIGSATRSIAYSVALQKKYSDRINHVHCKDIRKDVLADVRNRDLSFLDGVLNGMFTVPGDGHIDYTTLFEGLRESGYSG
jgi:inosose dehydratase|tara:strand:+ start:749 stop:1003 length:255 start_codon:yes stop_codon:yes gene_type:complete